jgi:transposase
LFYKLPASYEKLHKTAVKLLGEVMVLSPDMSAKQWVAHAGLFPQIIQSGSSINKQTRMSKAGNRYIRGALYMPALVAAHSDSHISGFYSMLQFLSLQK